MKIAWAAAKLALPNFCGLDFASWRSDGGGGHNKVLVTLERSRTLTGRVRSPE